MPASHAAPRKTSFGKSRYCPNRHLANDRSRSISLQQRYFLRKRSAGMFAFPNMAIDEIKDDVNLIVRFHFRGTMIAFGKSLSSACPTPHFSLIMRTIETDCV